MLAQRTALESGGFATFVRWLRVVTNHPGADAPPLLGKEGNVHLDDFLCKATTA